VFGYNYQFLGDTHDKPGLSGGVVNYPVNLSALPRSRNRHGGRLYRRPRANPRLGTAHYDDGTHDLRAWVIRDICLIHRDCWIRTRIMPTRASARKPLGSDPASGPGQCAVL
jgi:hypothetical protein